VNKNQEEYLKQQVNELREQTTRLAAGSRQLMQALDAVLLSAAMECGKVTEDGYELAIPTPDVKLLQDWTVLADRDEDVYKVTVKRKSKEGGM